MAGLDRLTLSLNQAQQAKGRLAGLDENYTRAAALRDKEMTAPNKYGYTSPLAAINKVVGNYQGRKQMEALAPQREQARSQIAAGESALPLYNAKVSEDAVARNAFEYDTDRTDKKDAALKLATAKAARMDTPVTYVDRIDGSGEITGYPTEGGGVVDNKGNPLDIQEKVPYDTWMQQQAKEVTAANTAANLARLEQGKWSKSTEEDPYGNELTTYFNTTTLEKRPPIFSDGTLVTPEEQKKRGDLILAQSKQEKLNTLKDKADIKAIERSVEKSDTLGLSINELDKALGALNGVDGNMKANTGPFSDLLFSVRGNAKKLENARDQLALFEIGKYAFGALSEKEGQWLKDVTIPLSLDEDELIPYLEKKRKALRRYQAVESMTREMREAGLTPTREEKDAILYAGGFTFAD